MSTQLPPPAPASGSPFRETPHKAEVALICGIIGLMAFGTAFPLSIAAWVLGRRAERQIRESEGALTGVGLAQAGWITGAIGVLLPVLIVGGYFVLVAASGGF